MVVAPGAGIRVRAGAGIRIGAGAGIRVGSRLAAPMSIRRYPNFLASLQTRCRTHAAALLAFVMSEALGSRPAPGTHPGSPISRDTPERSAWSASLPKEPHAQCSWHLQRAVTASAVRGSARRRARAISPRVRGLFLLAPRRTPPPRLDSTRSQGSDAPS